MVTRGEAAIGQHPGPGAPRPPTGLREYETGRADEPNGGRIISSTEDRWSWRPTTSPHAFMGPALPIETRLAMIESIVRTSDTTCVDLKDVSRGPEGALDVIRGIVRGLDAEYYHVDGAGEPT